MSIEQTKNRKNDTRAVVEYENMDSQILKRVGALRALSIGFGILCALMVVVSAALNGNMLCVLLMALSGLVAVFTFVCRLKIEGYYTRVESSRGRIIEDSPYTLATEEKFYI